MKSGKLKPIVAEYIRKCFQNCKIDALKKSIQLLSVLKSETGHALLSWSSAERSVRQTIPTLHQCGAQPDRVDQATIGR